MENSGLGSVVMDGRRIGEFAALTGVSADTVRYYEKVRLLPRAGRNAVGYRLYDDDDLERMQFIRQAQTHSYQASGKSITKVIRLT